MEFKVGRLLATRGVDDRVMEDKKFARFVTNSLQRYFNCDWGDLDIHDKRLNESAVRNNNDRIFARYNYDDETSIYIITEWDRSATTILFPEEY